MVVKEGLVSVVMPAHNSSRFIRESIESVLSQSYSAFELIIVDDRSLDNTKEIVESYCAVDERIKLISNNDDKGGAFYARNLALEHCTGQYISFLDSDDFWHPEKLTKQVTLMNNSDFYASHCAFYRVDEKSNIINKVSVLEVANYADQLKSNRIPNLTGIYDRSKLGLFKQKNIGHEDYEMWLNILSQTSSIGVDSCLASYRVTAGSLSSNKIEAALWHYKILASRPDLNMLGRFWLFVNYVFFAVLKRI